MTWRTCSVVAAALALSACEVHCGTPRGLGTTVSREAVVQLIGGIVQPWAQQAPERVECPGEGPTIQSILPRFECTAYVLDGSVQMKVEVDHAAGRISATAPAFFIGDVALAQHMSERLRDGDSEVAVTCPGPRLHHAKVGESVVCKGTSELGEGEVTATWEDAQTGSMRIKFTVERAGLPVDERGTLSRPAVLEYFRFLARQVAGFEPDDVACPGDGERIAAWALRCRATLDGQVTEWIGSSEPESGRLSFASSDRLLRRAEVESDFADDVGERVRETVALSCPARRIYVAATGTSVDCEATTAGQEKYQVRIRWTGEGTKAELEVTGSTPAR